MRKSSIVFLLVLFFCANAQAQLCTGSLGDPVVNITFGNEGVARGPLRAGITNLGYTNSSCPDDGNYTITNASIGCFGNTWHRVEGDHTGDAGGRYMLINASLTPNDFYLDTVSGLCGNTVYEFATWVANVLRSTACGNSIKPNLTFKIETVTGTVIQRFDTGDIPEEPQKVWKQYGTFFTTPSGVDRLVIRITNNSRGGCGNDLALDDITFKPCGPKVSAYMNADSSALINVCQNEQRDMPFTASFSGSFMDPVLQWQLSVDTGRTWRDIPGATTTTFIRSPTGGGLFQYRLVIAERGNFSSVQCRIASNVTTITVNPLPGPPLDNRILGCTGADLRIEAVGGIGFSYRWSGPNGFQDTVRNPVLRAVNYTDSGRYVVVVRTDVGCTRNDTLQVNVFPGATATASTGGTICEGNSIALNATGGGTYLWTPSNGLSNPASGNPIASPRDSTAYKVVVTNSFGCKDSAQSIVNVLKKPVVNAGPDQQIFEGNGASLQGAITGNVARFYWLPNTQIDNSTSITPVVSPLSNTTYTLYAVLNMGCGLVSDEVFVRVYKKINAPNFFSPNGDGIHDSWEIAGLDTYPNAQLSLFSRNGQLVYQSTNYTGGWKGLYKGKPLPVGTYYYTLDLKIGLPVQSGWVLIAR